MAKGASSRPRPSKQKPEISRWTLFGAGFFCGIFTCIFLWQALIEPKQAAASKEASTAAPKPEPAPATTDSSQTQFDFFTLLPEREVIVPDTERLPERRNERSASTENGADAAPATEAADKQYFILQAGSFKNLADADRRRAQILLLGLDAKIETVEANGDTWNRV